MRARATTAILTSVSALAIFVSVSAQPLPAPELPSPTANAAPAPGTLADSIARHPQCRERTNGCELCLRADDGGLGCSTPGIACQPEHWRCTTDPDAREPLPAPK